MKLLSQLMSIETDVKNTGDKKLENIPIELSFNNQRVGQVITDLNLNLKNHFFSRHISLKNGILKV